MSFKYRLRTFFFLLTVLPLLAAGYAVQEVFKENRASRVDTSIASTLGASISFYELERDIAIQLADHIVRDPTVLTSIGSGQYSALNAELAARTVPPLLLGYERNGALVAGFEPTGTGFAARRQLADPKGKPLGTLVAGFDLDQGVAGRLSSGDVTIGFLTGHSLVTQDGTRQVAFPVAHPSVAFDATIGGEPVRMLVRSLGDATPAATAVVALYPRSLLDQETTRVRETVAIAIAVVLIAILVLAELLVRSITGQLAVFARRAREVGEGKFVGELPVHGNDEFALFAGSFNQMAIELERRIEELESERRRVQEAVARFGQALESTHDVSALLGIVIESAMEAVHARGGRVMIVDEASGSLVENRRIGSAIEASATTLPETVVLGSGVEGTAAQTGRAAVQNDPVPILCVPLQTTQAVIGLLTLIDPIDRQFSAEDGQTIQGLASQGAIAIENARMHRLVAKQASTDGLTGLANHREFQDQLRREVERAQRFGLPLALILLDLDDFKMINDRFSHLTGDSVLRTVAGTLRASIREIDCAARYGGEEFAVILPGTTSEGAARLAERLRIGIAEKPVTFAEGRVVSVTASFGVAALPADGATQVELVAAADEALYDAKRAGKNRVVIATGSREPNL